VRLRGMRSPRSLPSIGDVNMLQVDQSATATNTSIPKQNTIKRHHINLCKESKPAKRMLRV
jgi:hypothetical protein